MHSCCCGPTAGGRVVGERVGGAIGWVGRFALFGRKIGAIAIGFLANASCDRKYGTWVPFFPSLRRRIWHQGGALDY